MQQCARSLKRLSHSLSEELGFRVGKSMVKRLLKKLGYSWKRFRKSLKKLQNQGQYEQKLAQLKQLAELNKGKFLDLYFADESGFNMEGYLPYGWQPKGEYIHITPQKSKATQVFGIMSADNRLTAYSSKGTLNSQAIIAFLSDFASQLKQQTVVVLDNASVHRTAKFTDMIQTWEQQGLYLFFLPTYSPHLNLIETLWRKIKYEWLEFEHIPNQERLDQELDRILNQFGKQYTIKFENG